MNSQPITTFNFTKLIRPLLLAVSVALPWMIGIAIGNADLGGIASFGTYLLIISFPHLPDQHVWGKLLCAALLLSVFVALGVNITLGSLLFFAVTALVALLQGISECRGGILNLPVALAVLAFFLTVGQVKEGGELAFIGAFLGGTLWGSIAAFTVIERSKGLETPPLALSWGRGQRRFLIGIVGAALLGSTMASAVPSTHPGWLPAAALRVLKPARQQTLKRMRDRGLGTLLGAAFGGLLLGLYTSPWLHAFMVLLLVFTMLLIGAKRYAAWTFCLTAIALTFNLAPGTSVVTIMADRLLLTVGGLSIAALAWFILAEEQESQSGK